MKELFGFGLRLESDLPVPGALPVCDSDTADAITIMVESEPAESTSTGFAFENGTIVYMHPAGRFQCTADCIRVAPAKTAEWPDLGALLIANALPALLWQRGAFMLHAAAVQQLEGFAYALAGRSGRGKSTLAAHFVKGGSELVGEDSLALTRIGSILRAVGLSGGWFSGVADTPDRRFNALPPASSRGSATLAAIVILEDLQNGPPGLTRLPLLESVEQLLLHRHRPQVPALLGRQAAVLAQAADIARALPVLSWRRPVHDMAAPDEANELLRCLNSEITA